MGFLTDRLASVQAGKPSSEDATYRRIEQALQKHEYPSAEAQLLEWVKQKPKSAEAHFLLGILYTEEGEPQKARGFFLTALRLLPNSTSVLDNLGFNALSLGNESEAGHYFKKVLSIDPNDTNALYNLALAELKQKEFAQAEQHMKRASVINPKDISILQGLLAAEVGMGAKEDLNKTVDSILKLAPRESEFYIKLARPLVDQGLYPAGLRVLEQARVESPDSAEVAYNLARAYYLSGNPQPARQLAEAALAKQDSAPLHNLLGAIYEQVRLYDKAVAEYQAAIHLEPGNEAYYFDLAHEFLIHYNFDLAEEIFDTAVKRFPASEKLRLGLAVAYFAQLRYDKAVPTLKAAIELEPESPLGYFFLGKAFVLLSNERDLFNDAWVDLDFQKYSELRPNDPIPYYVRAVRLLRQDSSEDNQRDEALRLLQKTLEIDPSFPEAYLELGNVYFKNKQYQQAIDAYQRAVDLNQASAEAYYGLSLAYARSGDTEKAKEASTMALKRHKEMHEYVAARQKEMMKFVYTLK
jgi:tetratricopeptide (TPR) repeat protein